MIAVNNPKGFSADYLVGNCPYRTSFRLDDPWCKHNADQLLTLSCYRDLIQGQQRVIFYFHVTNQEKSVKQVVNAVKSLMSDCHSLMELQYCCSCLKKLISRFGNQNDDDQKYLCSYIWIGSNIVFWCEIPMLVKISREPNFILIHEFYASCIICHHLFILQHQIWIDKKISMCSV